MVWSINERGFSFITGCMHRRRRAMGALHFRARMYDTSAAIFYAADPANQAASRYGYCGGNPIIMVDPTGREYGKYQTADMDADQNNNNRTEFENDERNAQFARNQFNVLPSAAQKAIKDATFTLNLMGGHYEDRSTVNGGLTETRIPFTHKGIRYYAVKYEYVVTANINFVWVADEVASQNPLDEKGFIITFSFDRSIASIDKGKISSAGIAVNLFNGSAIKYRQSGNAIGFGGNIGFNIGLNWCSSLNDFIGYDYSGTNVFKNPNGNTGSLDIVVASGTISVDQKCVPFGVSFGIGPSLGGVISATQHTDYDVLSR